MTLRDLRVLAISNSLFAPTSLKAAVQRLKFVQADPIRAPARAQDLILRHRVRNYRAGDLDRKYHLLDLEEDILYAYGFLPRRVWQLLHPRNTKGLSAFEKEVFDVVCSSDETHPADLQEHFGSRRVINAWGGYSRATTSALESLHYRGLIRIARREKGIRIYEAMPPRIESQSPVERLQQLIKILAMILGPVPMKTLHAVTARYRYLGNTRQNVAHLISNGELRREAVDGLTYAWPAGSTVRGGAKPEVRFLAPFDPVVWDRLRFEHLWGWPYRFEAYTPPAKRLRGYYAMPLLWRDRVIGWANAGGRNGNLKVDVGFVEKQPDEKVFRSELDLEIQRLEAFLKSK